jgi:choline dehydrogenase-like flavoprotein
LSERYQVVVVGSGAGGGVVAGELADRGRRVLLLEVGPHRTAANYMRWEAHASHELWWPPAFAEPADVPGPPMIVFRGRCVGGTTVINTKVALRPDADDYAKWRTHGRAGIRGARCRARAGDVLHG